jgi:hypothetical protein
MKNYISKSKKYTCDKEKNKTHKDHGMGVVNPIIETDAKEIKTDDNVEWEVDVSDEAVEERKKELCNPVANKLLQNTY